MKIDKKEKKFIVKIFCVKVYFKWCTCCCCHWTADVSWRHCLHKWIFCFVTFFSLSVLFGISSGLFFFLLSVALITFNGTCTHIFVFLRVECVWESALSFFFQYCMIHIRNGFYFYIANGLLIKFLSILWHFTRTLPLRLMEYNIIANK